MHEILGTKKSNLEISEYNPLLPLASASLPLLLYLSSPVVGIPAARIGVPRSRPAEVGQTDAVTGGRLRGVASRGLAPDCPEEAAKLAAAPAVPAEAAAAAAAAATVAPAAAAGTAAAAAAGTAAVGRDGTGVGPALRPRISTEKENPGQKLVFEPVAMTMQWCGALT